jgi:uroporphyrinogen-III synthase
MKFWRRWGHKMEADQALVGRHIVVTRPAGQASHLAEALTQLGAVPVLFPALVICDVDNNHALLDAAARLDAFDFAIFISPNAVSKALDQILSRRSWPPQTRIATMGKSSEAELARYGLTEILAPNSRFDSEALLELPALQDVQGRSIVIFRGDGGRELLGESLAARGATVEYVACYRRIKPTQNVEPLLRLWRDAQLDAITLTSSEGLRNFYAMIGKLGQSWLKKTPLFVPHARIAEGARQLGLSQITVTNPGDDGLIAGLLRYFQAYESQSSR